MKLARLRVQNLRSISDTGDFDVPPLLAFVGENNCGKSNLLRAIDILLTAGTAGLQKNDFKDPSGQILIKGWFDDLTSVEKKRWNPYLVAGRLILEKHITLSADERSGRDKVTAELHGYRAEPCAWYLSFPKIHDRCGDRPRWAEIVKEASLPDYFLRDAKCSKADYEKGLSRFLAENDVDYEAPDLSVTQALGFASNAAANLPRVYLLPAITDYSDEVDRRATNSTFRRLMGDLSERILQTDPRFPEIRDALATVRALLNTASAAGGPLRMPSLSAVEERVATLVRRLMPSVRRVAVGVEIQSLSDLFSAGVRLTIDDGVETDVLAKGHGLQRCMVFSLLQALILNDRGQLIDLPSDTSHPDRSIVLLIEEPELYIHPQLGKIVFDVMREFSRTDQVVYSTHSPLFVDAYEHQSVARVFKPCPADGTKVRTCDTSAFEGLKEQGVFRGLAKLNSSISELFFARRVLLVEGPGDVVAVTAVLQKLGKIRERVEELDWSVIPCGGKQSIPFFQRVLNSFGIPYSVLHDSDIDDDMPKERTLVAQRQNAAIRELAGDRPVHSFPVSLERSLGCGHFDDQYEAHCFFLDHSRITPEVEDIVAGAFR